MTKEEIIDYELKTKIAINRIENKFNVIFWYYDNGLGKYIFKVDDLFHTLDIHRDVMIRISNIE